MTDPHGQPSPTTQDLLDAVADLGRVVGRQATSIAALVDDARAAAARSRAGADVPLLVELFALHGDALTLAATATSEDERRGFTSLAAGIERLVAGRGARLIEPAEGVAFDAATMEAAEVVGTDDPDRDRTVARLLRPGLLLVEAGRAVRPARVAVYRARESDGSLHGA